MENDGKKKRNSMIDETLHLIRFQKEDLDELMEIYISARKRKFCPWTEEYPTREIIEMDIEKGNLYGFRNETGKIIASIAKDCDEQVDGLAFWGKELQPAAEVARVVVAPGYEGRGIARMLIRGMMAELRKRGYKGIHYMVAEHNIPAVRSYAALGFSKAGETDMYGEHYLCFEKMIKNQ